MPQPPRPEARSDVVVSLDRRRGERRDLRAGHGYPAEVLELLRVCGARLRAGDGAAAPVAANDRRTDGHPAASD